MISPAAVQQIFEVTTPRTTKYMVHTPFPRQVAFLLQDKLEVLYGGQAGGGKSDALLMAALQYVDCPDYAAILFRRSYADLALPGALMDRAHDWLANSGARWREIDKRWEFPSGASLSFGYLETDRDKYRYQSAEFQMIGFDELTQFEETQYTYLFSRLRRLKDSKIPIRMRSASNPGGVGHSWVKKRFIDLVHPERRFIRAPLRENPHVDQDAYLIALENLDPVTRSQLRDGSWTATDENSIIKRFWFDDKILPATSDQIPWAGRKCRYWDLASTKGKKSDYTAGVLGLIGRVDSPVGNGFVVANVKRLKGTGREVENLINATAYEDGWSTPIVIEMENGASGRLLVDHYIRNVLPGFIVKGDPPTGNKITRMLPLAGQAEAGNMWLVKAAWNEEYLAEGEVLNRADTHPHDDMWDATAGAYNNLTQRKFNRSINRHPANVLLYQR